ncbi:MAG: 1-acyl-sn-glycerol-3-phosphate acyltransferase [Spirochaetales bacterium]|nr:1-acyl-sn-glycerol-3-phosphate acyltransferase [Spirochaetales bacterium]
MILKKPSYDFTDMEAFKGQAFKDALNYIANDYDTLSKFRKFFKPYVPPPFSKLYDKIFVNRIKKYLLSFKSVDDFQANFISNKVLKHILNSSVDKFSFEGLEKLDTKERYLFVSNHRDIVLDPALFNYALFKAGFTSAQIAFGDNLIYNRFVEYLIRINKGFVVRRNLSQREQLQESMKLSAYINHTLENNESIWIAQRSGRAKDGNDFTRTAILKMFYLSKRKQFSFQEYVKWAKIVPVSISYEYDPCDIKKAAELADPDFKKNKMDDINSIRLGIEKQKGSIKVVFGDVLESDSKKPKYAADLLDHQIINNYYLWPSNYISYDLLNYSDKYKDFYTETQKSDFLKRYKDVDSEVFKFVLHQYANPVFNKNIVRIGEKDD